jgi:hypothetical protein
LHRDAVRLRGILECADELAEFLGFISIDDDNEEQSSGVPVNAF